MPSRWASNRVATEAAHSIKAPAGRSTGRRTEISCNMLGYFPVEKIRWNYAPLRGGLFDLSHAGGRIRRRGSACKNGCDFGTGRGPRFPDRRCKASRAGKAFCPVAVKSGRNVHGSGLRPNWELWTSSRLIHRVRPYSAARPACKRILDPARRDFRRLIFLWIVDPAGDGLRPLDGPCHGFIFESAMEVIPVRPARDSTL